MNTKTPCTDHKGITYESIKEMCDAYGVSPTLYLKRIERGWSHQEALEGKQPYFSREGKDVAEICIEGMKPHAEEIGLLGTGEG